MKSLIVLILLFSSSQLHAQTRVLAGVTGGSSFSNLYVGPVVELEAPIGHHLELDASDNFSPFEEHIALGQGWSNFTRAGGVVWITKSVGLTGSASYSTYHTNITKAGEYSYGGVMLRKKVDFVPMRFRFEYIREFDNGISADGTESSRLQGGDFNLDMRIKCAGGMCLRTAFDFKVGHVLTQGNPQCDGSFSPAVMTCPRAGSTSGAFSVAVRAEWPRRRMSEEEAF